MKKKNAKPSNECVECNAIDWLSLVDKYQLCMTCGNCIPPENEPSPPLGRLHHYLLRDLKDFFPEHYMANRTALLYRQMWQYKKEKRVFRLTVMGETRGGKTESGQTIAFNNILIYNEFLRRGHYKNVPITKQVKFRQVTLEMNHIYANESEYHYKLTDDTRDGKLVFGQLHFIDEDKEGTGGMGTMSEQMEMLNRNNIIAKFMQDEVWINPRKFLKNNTPFGIHVFIKDEERRMNWSLLYKIQPNSEGLSEQNFIGWVGVRLHPFEEFRKKYEEKKDEWILDEIEGKPNERIARRQKAIEYVANLPTFNQTKINKVGDVVFKKNIESQKFIVEQSMMNKEIDVFNEGEIERIVHGARTRIEQRMLGETK